MYARATENIIRLRDFVMHVALKVNKTKKKKSAKAKFWSHKVEA